mgnify:CR=1 FL=1
MEFHIGQVFQGVYPPEAADWCNSTQRAYIVERDAVDGERQFEIVAVPEPTLEEVKTAKLSEINAAADRAIATLTATYPDREISTFDKQESEARAYAADPTASTPLLSALAQARGIPLPDLVERVLAKADAFAVASGSIIGQRQALEDRLDACTTLEDVQGITVNISMPGGGEA